MKPSEARRFSGKLAQSHHPPQRRMRAMGLDDLVDGARDGDSLVLGLCRRTAIPCSHFPPNRYEGRTWVWSGLLRPKSPPGQWSGPSSRPNRFPVTPARRTSCRGSLLR